MSVCPKAVVSARVCNHYIRLVFMMTYMQFSRESLFQRNQN